jgi:hypothetical protein
VFPARTVVNIMACPMRFHSIDPIGSGWGHGVGGQEVKGVDVRSVEVSVKVLLAVRGWFVFTSAQCSASSL